MEEYKGRINVSKDTMLFVTNHVLENEIKESTTKENILKLMPEIYEKADSKEIIKMLPYETYKALEDLINYIKTSNDITKFYYKTEHTDVRYLEEALIIVMRAKKNKHEYQLNPGVIEKIEKIFSNENKEIAKRYGKIEKLTKGMLYSYGVVEFEFFRKQICKYMNEIITEDELYDLYFKRLNLNLDVNYYHVRWMNDNEKQDFITYLDREEDSQVIGFIANQQKSRRLNYKVFTKEEILSRDEYLWDKSTQELFQYLKSQNEYIWEYPFQRIIKRNEFGEKILNELLGYCNFKNENDVVDFMKIFLTWYNNSPQYVLGGYSPVEFMIQQNDI